MPSLQSSGAISLSDLRTFFSRSGTVSLSQFYTGTSSGFFAPLGGFSTYGVPSSGAISLSSFYNYIPYAGYFGGGVGASIGYSGEIDGIRFDTESSINPSNSLSLGRTLLAGVNSSTRGYFGGGLTGASQSSAEIDGMIFITESSINPSATLALSRYYLAGVNSSTRGYFSGGAFEDKGLNVVNEIDGIQFSTESAVNPSAGLSVYRYALTGVNSSTRGYFAGGYANNYSSEIDGIEFSTESAINPSTTLSVARDRLAGFNSDTRGYFGGGQNAAGKEVNITSEIDGIQFSTESAVNPSASLASARYNLAGVNSSTRGYFAGGYANNYSSEIDGIEFSTESAINPSTTLSVARSAPAGVQSGSY